MPLLRVIGCNSVTRHDAHVSMIAGFQGKELTMLWPANSGFQIDENEAGFASHLFMAYRDGFLA
jgi:hypothetical protein